MNAVLKKHLGVSAPSESNLATIVLDQALKTLLLTAANKGCGTTTSALSLATELAGSSRGRVLLVDTSLSADNLSQRLGQTSRPGFLDWVLAEQPLELSDYIVSSQQLPFDFMALGHQKKYSQRLAPALLRPALAKLTQVYRFVILDGEAIYANADTLAISAVVDGVVLVVRAEETRWEVAQAATQRLNQAGAKVIGGILNARRYYMPKWLYDYL